MKTVENSVISVISNDEELLDLLRQLNALKKKIDGFKLVIEISLRNDPSETSESSPLENNPSS